MYICLPLPLPPPSLFFPAPLYRRDISMIMQSHSTYHLSRCVLFAFLIFSLLKKFFKQIFILT